MKIKIISRMDASDFQNNVNSFIKNKNITDIKYSTSHDPISRRTHYSAMIMYKEN